MGYLYEACDEKWAYMFNVYKNQQSRQTRSRNLMGRKTLPTIWGTYMKLVTKYQISAINSCWEKCDEKWAYMFNVYKNQQSRQTGSRNLMGPKTLPTIWGTYMKLVTKYQISAINSCWEKCDEKYHGWTEGRTDRGKTVYPPPPLRRGGIIKLEASKLMLLIWSFENSEIINKKLIWTCIHQLVITVTKLANRDENTNFPPQI